MSLTWSRSQLKQSSPLLKNITVLASQSLGTIAVGDPVQMLLQFEEQIARLQDELSKGEHEPQKEPREAAGKVAAQNHLVAQAYEALLSLLRDACRYLSCVYTSYTGLTLLAMAIRRGADEVHHKEAFKLNAHSIATPFLLEVFASDFLEDAASRLQDVQSSS